MSKKLVFGIGILVFVILIAFVVTDFFGGEKKEEGEPSPDLDLELSALGDFRVGSELLIKLAITPAPIDLGREFFDTPVEVKFTLPDSFELTAGDIDQEIYFSDFSTRISEIKVRPSEKGIFDAGVDVTKQNSGAFRKNLALNIEQLEAGPESPEIEVEGNITEFIRNFLESAPDGYKWEYSLDWDETITKFINFNTLLFFKRVKSSS